MDGHCQITWVQQRDKNASILADNNRLDRWSSFDFRYSFNASFVINVNFEADRVFHANPVILPHWRKNKHLWDYINNRRLLGYSNDLESFFLQFYWVEEGYIKIALNWWEELSILNIWHYTNRLICTCCYP